jgi:hypothetical protein
MQGDPMRPDIVVEPKVDLRFSVFAGLIHAKHTLALTKLSFLALIRMICESVVPSQDLRILSPTATK